MAEPHIQYCTSADGTRIAFVLSEEGRPPPVFFINYVFLPIASQRFGVLLRTALMSERQWLRMDRRGIGHSQRDASDFSLDAQVADVLAVATRAGAPQFDLMGFGDGCWVAAAFAARHPHLVRRMFLSTPTLPGTDSARQSIATMVTSSWTLGRGTIADVALGGNADADVRRGYIRFLAEATSPKTAASYLQADWDPRAELESVVAPTLVVATKRRLSAAYEGAQALAAAIPGARLVAQDASDPFSAYYGSDDFLRIRDGHAAADDTPASAMQAPPASSAMAVILFADIADSTALTERLGDAAFRERARTLDDALRTIVRDNGGTPIEGKLLGDGILATFPAASQAITAALAYEHSATSVDLGLHVGLHAGDVLREANNVFGGAVNIASRISALAPPGEVFVSRTVADLARTSAGVTFEDRGEHALKGIADPVRVFAVRGDRP
jgi:class 3 adenylate cyclase/pimeloyl-ACP methyl ester carboxylesterase